MKFLWPILLAVFRTLYWGYALWCLAFPLALWWLWRHSAASPGGLSSALWALGGFALALVVLVYLRRQKDDPNPWQSSFMAWFGSLRGFANLHPSDMVHLSLPSLYLVENPQGYRIGGRQQRAVLKQLQPGDILLRGYRGYVDGAFIRLSSRCWERGYRRGWYTHAALYVGETTEQDRALVPQPFRHDAGYFETGPQMVIHSMAKGVHTEDILTFCRCDYLVVLRVRAQGGAVDVAQAVQDARRAALTQIGQEYDFDQEMGAARARTHAAADGATQPLPRPVFHRFSCSQLVYYCYYPIREALQLAPRLHALYPLGHWSPRLALLRRTTVTPDDYYSLLEAGTLEHVWEDAASLARPGAWTDKASPQGRA